MSGSEVRTYSRDTLREHVERANGMLPFAVYIELWNAARECCGSTFVEIGTAHGAATIAMTCGALSAGRQPTVHSIDTLSGVFSSRSHYGSIRENKAMIERNFAAAGITHNVSLFVGSSEEFMASGTCPPQIDLLMLDADGRIDRDLLYFFPRLAEDALIVIDDVDCDVYWGLAADGRPYVDLKHRTTRLLLDAFVAEGFLNVGKVMHATAFCTKGARTPRDAARIAEIALPCYRALVFTPLTGRFWRCVFKAWRLRNTGLSMLHGSRARVSQLLRLAHGKLKPYTGSGRG